VKEQLVLVFTDVDHERTATSHLDAPLRHAHHHFISYGMQRSASEVLTSSFKRYCWLH